MRRNVVGVENPWEESKEHTKQGIVRGGEGKGELIGGAVKVGYMRKKRWGRGPFGTNN